MASDIFEQLAETKVPPVPVDALERGFSNRLNNRITVQQVLDLALRGLPYAALHMTRGMVAVLYYTVFGRFIERKQDGQPGDAREET